MLAMGCPQGTCNADLSIRPAPGEQDVVHDREQKR
jgi:hypothetical protein